MVRAGAYWHKIHDIHACAFAVETKESVISFGFLFRPLLRTHCKTFNITAEKPKFYPSTVVYFTLADDFNLYLIYLHRNDFVSIRP